MEHFFGYDSRGEFPWLQEILPLNQSAFASYTNQSAQGFGAKGSGYPLNNHRNVNKRMIEFLRKNRTPVAVGPVEAEREKNHKHMINERMRREKEKQSYIELHKLLPHGTKNDKKSIAQVAVKAIEELETNKEELKRKNYELETALGAGGDNRKIDETTIKLRVAFPSSGIDSMLEVLKCLKSSGAIAKAMQSSFATHEFSAVLQIETKKGAAEVEKALNNTLLEVEKKFRCPFPED